MAVISFNHIAQYVQDVTSEQIDTATRIVDMETMHPFYLVQSSRDPLVEYKVTYSAKFGFQCTCESGLHGFWNVKHPSGVCQHVRIAVASSEEYKALIKAQAQADALQAAQTVPAPAPVVKIEYSDQDAETLARIQRRDQERKERKPSRKVAYCQTRPAGFSLFK